MAQGATQKCRLFIEGREVPFVAATLVCNVGEPITAMIDLVPAEPIRFVRPKTQVHIFVQDRLNFGDNNFYLAFEGEIVAKQMGKSQNARYFRVTAVDYTGYWDEAKTFFYNHNFIVGHIGEVTRGSPSVAFVSRAGGMDQMKGAATLTSEMIRQILADGKSDLVQGVASVFKNLKKINLFYKAAWDRLRISDRVRVFTSGRITEFLKDINKEVFLDAFMGQQGGMSSLREALLNVMGLVFHDFVSVPFPSFVSYSKGSAAKTIGNFLFVPDGYSLPPPKCNVIFPNQLSSMEFSEDFMAAPTRFVFRASLPEFVQEKVSLSTFPAQVYPTSFSDYMFRTKNQTQTEKESLLGTSKLLLDPVTGNSYAGVNYGDKKNKAVSTSIAPVLREADFLTNEESIRGISLSLETLVPGMSALATHASPAKRMAFTQEIGKYLFFKKRFAPRSASAQLMFHPFLVPGFNCIVVDDSDANQTVVAKLQSVVHNLSNQGCSTSITLGYARTFDEVDALTGGVGDPPTPRWFDTSIFGKVDESAFKNETIYLKDVGVITAQEQAARSKISGATTFTRLSTFYQELLGCDAVTDIDSVSQEGQNTSKLCTSRGAAFYLRQDYRNIATNDVLRDTKVMKYIRRPVPTLSEAFSFLGAVPQSKNDKESPRIPAEFAQFVATTEGNSKGLFDGKGYPDETILKIRREVIDEYFALLRTKRGFRG